MEFFKPNLQIINDLSTSNNYKIQSEFILLSLAVEKFDKSEHNLDKRSVLII